ncbi:MFS transporter [Bacillus suaedae]|uniref:MFS transporter n=1 Tax=Halalkalibacter suaedae TaxID=2822140 RepID=A0A940X0Y5_9BACI|nr:MFS transporter [Bacillus suaedae]MBP3953406.1 MFS transporter [Bacillus suaedae]
MSNSTKLLWLLSFAQFLAMQVWFNFSSVLPVLQEEWGLNSTESGWIMALFHAGYVMAIFFYSFFISNYHPKHFFVYGALLAAISGVLFSFYADGFWSAMILRTLSGIGVAGIYVPGMRIVAELFPPNKRGKAMGIYVGSLVVGSGSSLLVSAMLINWIGWNGVILTTSLLSFIAALLVFFANIPDNISHRPLKLTTSKLKLVFQKKNLLINAGYTGHCWELYAMWSWIGPFLVFYFNLNGFDEAQALQFGNITGALIIMIGGFATYIGGTLSDQYGRGRTTTLFLLVSIACSFTIGWLTTIPFIIMIALTVIYGFTIVADSPIYNTAISEVTDPELLGLALGIQSILGFSATIFAPLFFGFLLDNFSWGVAFSTVGLLTLIAPICMYLFSRLEKSKRELNQI